MKQNFPPPEILDAALRTLHCAACYTRNWRYSEAVTQKQIYDLWEAIHELPELLTRWNGDESEKEMRRYFREYSDKWDEPNLEARFDDILKGTQNG